MRRLSIIDLAGGDQPIGNEDGSVQVVFNGEIYNYRELAGRAARPRAPLRTDSDTEVLVHLYEEHGDRLRRAAARDVRLRLWDARRSGGCCWPATARGSSRSTYREPEGRSSFASELKAILRAPGRLARGRPRRRSRTT